MKDRICHFHGGRRAAACCGVRSHVAGFSMRKRTDDESYVEKHRKEGNV